MPELESGPGRVWGAEVLDRFGAGHHQLGEIVLPQSALALVAQEDRDGRGDRAQPVAQWIDFCRWLIPDGADETHQGATQTEILGARMVWGDSGEPRESWGRRRLGTEGGGSAGRPHLHAAPSLAEQDRAGHALSCGAAFRRAMGAGADQGSFAG